MNRGLQSFEFARAGANGELTTTPDQARDYFSRRLKFSIPRFHRFRNLYFYISAEDQQTFLCEGKIQFLCENRIISEIPFRKAIPANKPAISGGSPDDLVWDFMPGSVGPGPDAITIETEYATGTKQVILCPMSLFVEADYCQVVIEEFSNVDSSGSGTGDNAFYLGVFSQGGKGAT